MRKLALLAAAAFAATAVPASATITINTLQQTDQGENVLFNPTPPDGPSVVGFTNQSNTSVTFTTLTGQTLHTPANGQARIEAVNDALDSLRIQLTSGDFFDYIEFNLTNAGSPGTADTVTIYGIDDAAQTFQHTFTPLSNGSNFFALIASAGEHIQRVEFNNVDTGFTDIRQIRINGIQGVQPVPEASTWAMMIIGFGAAGAAMRRSRRKALLTQVA